MEKVIKQIMEIEEKAQKIIDDALLEKKQKEKEHKLRVEALEYQIINDAKLKVQQIRDREFNDIKEAEEEKVTKCVNHLLEMDKYADDNMDEWVENLVRRVLS